MIVKVELVVLMAELKPTPINEGSDTNDYPWLNAYKIKIGVNATSVQAAVSIASRAMSNCFDEEGYYLGGVVIETHGKLVSSDEFRSCEKYFDQSMEESGIFYLSGTVTIGVPRPALSGAIEYLQQFQTRRAHGAEEFGKPSYIRRHYDDPEELKRLRIVCPVCGSWQEHEHRNFMFWPA